MRLRNLAMALAAVAALAAGTTDLAAQKSNPRLGAWKMKSDAPAPFSNVMTYQPHGEGGMSVTVEATNARGEASKWGYVTMFDGVYRPVQGQQNAETAVENIDDRSTRILNKRNGKVSQVIINTLSEDGNTIFNEYVRFDDAGRVMGVSHAVYERIR